MSLAERLERLEPRERVILGALAAVVVAAFILAVPWALSGSLDARREQNLALKQAITMLQRSAPVVREKEAELQRIETRYAKPVPNLAGLLSRKAKETGVTVPETQDLAPLPHGEGYEERRTKLRVSKVGLANLMRFLEAIEASGHPISLSQVQIRKRAVEPDSYDADLVVSAYDRKAPRAAKSTGGKP